MNASLKLLTSITFITMAACSTQELKGDSSTITATDKLTTPAYEAEKISGQNPPMTIMKDGKKLNLVRIMDGGICKNEFQGAKGAFLLYADPTDIERIKREKGAAVFKDFETKIQDISGDVLQEAVENTNLSEDPFALGEDEAQQKLANKLANNFRKAAFDAITMFQKETTLTIDIIPFPPSLVFDQKGCEPTKEEPESSALESQLNAFYLD
jgi:hypothetical protein